MSGAGSASVSEDDDDGSQRAGCARVFNGRADFQGPLRCRTSTEGLGGMAAENDEEEDEADEENGGKPVV